MAERRAMEQRVILVDTDDEKREVLAARLRMQGWAVEALASPADGARVALASPPAVVVADLWTQGISGVQLCRLLRAEPATEHVPVILRGPLGARDRFWAERAGASAYVAKGRMGDLVRAINEAVARAPEATAFFTELGGEAVDVRDRIAAHLDAALFESVVAAEVRALGVCEDGERLFDQFTQLLTRLTQYRWVALLESEGPRFSLHGHPSIVEGAEREARETLAIADAVPASRVEDEDAGDDAEGPPARILDVLFGSARVARLAIAPRPDVPLDHALLETIARELGGPIRVATLVEQAQRLARTDALTKLLNRRAFTGDLAQEIARSDRYRWPLAVLLLDIDHFKSINDGHGHAMGDTVLAEVARCLQGATRTTDFVGRWGGEEFVVALTGTPADGGCQAGERIRAALMALDIRTDAGIRVPVTASIGVTAHQLADTVDSMVERADRAMYAAKTSGRNRVVVAAEREEPAVTAPGADVRA